MSVFMRINVPLFAMLSGALLLGRQETYTQIFKKRLLKIFMVTFGCSLLLYLSFGLFRNRTLTFHDFLYGFFAGNIKDFDSYWYLYAYMGFLLFLPFYRKIAQQMSRQDFYFLIAIHAVIYTLLPILNLILRFASLPPLVLSTTIDAALAKAPLAFYPLIGYYVDKHIDVMSITKRQWCTILLTLILCLFFTSLFVYIEGTTWRFTQNLLNLTTYINVIIIFLTIKKINFTSNHPNPSNLSNPTNLPNPSNLQSLLFFFSPLTFGVYLLDPIFKLITYEPIKSVLYPNLGYFVFSIIMCFISFICCSMITWLFLKITKSRCAN